MPKLLKLKKIAEGIRGETIILNKLNHPVKRIYYIKNVKKNTIIRGGHRHLKTNQTLIVFSGKFSIRFRTNNSIKDYNIKHNDNYNAIFVKNYEWHEMYNFSKDCIICVLASTQYNKKDYIFKI